MRLHGVRVPMFLAFAWLWSGAFAQIPIGSTFNIAVEADADQLAGGFAMDTFADSQGGTLHPFSHSLSVTDTEVGGGTVTTTSTAMANWTSAGAGTVAFRDMGWVRNSPQRHEAKLNNFFFGADVWSYTFQAEADGFFVMHYNVWYTGFGFGLLGVNIHWDGPGGGLDLQNPNDPTASGTFVRPLTSGTTYTIGIANSGNIFAAAGQGLSTGHMSADFDWSVNPVPEPSSLVVLGTAVVVLLARRRKVA